MTSPSDILSEIEKALESVTHSQWFMSPWHVEEDASAVRNKSDGSYICNASSDSFAAYIASCSPDRMREVLALARRAEELQRENAEKDARIAALEEALKPFGEKYAGITPSASEIADGAQHPDVMGDDALALITIDVAHIRCARTLLEKNDAQG